MIPQELIEYIESQKENKFTRSQIESYLISIGWPENIVKGAVEQVFGSSSDQLVAPTNSTLSQLQITDVKKTKSKKRKIFIVSIIILIILALFSGGGVYAYRYYLQPPARVAQKMFEKVSKVKSFSYDLDFSTKAFVKYSYPKYSDITGDSYDFSQKPETETKEADYNLQLKVLGGNDFFNTKELKNFMKFEASGSMFDLKNMEVAAETMAINDIIYARINKLPDFSAYSKLNLDFLLDQWIKIDLAGLMKRYSDDTKQSENPLNQKQLEELKEIIKNNKIFTVKEKMASEKINSQSTFHYKFSINEESLKKALAEIAKLTEQYDAVYDLESISKTLEFNLPDGEIWIGKNDYYPHRIKLTSPIEDLIPKGSNASSDNKITGDISMTINIHNFSKPINLTVPKDYKSVEEIWEEFSKLTPEKATGAETTLDSDSDGLSDTDETIYGTDPQNQDSDNDSYLDGEEVNNGYNPLGEGKLIDAPTADILEI